MLYITIRYISWFMISTNELLLVYFICILDYGYDVRQKVNSSDFFLFLFKFKLGHKAAETTWNINNAFGSGTAIECTVQWWFKKLCKGDENPEGEKCTGQPLEADNDPLRISLKLILLKLYKKFPKNSVSISLWFFGIWSKLETWESSISGWLISWPQIKKKLFWSVIFFYSMQQGTISWSDCDVR